MDHPSVADFMTPAPPAVDVTDTLRSAARTMAEQDLRALVVQDGTRAVGVVTDRDIVVRGLAAGLGAEATVELVIGDSTVTVGQSDSVEAAFDVMRAARVRRVPVLDRDTVVGLLTFGDLDVERDIMSVPTTW
ncbi:CBS domain-containing protein [Promicromonospora sp. NPDC059942]|uniref:CBS domain-containing protein n=1 Tax=Promicromonospora sp. NPDC059942 TaxID=3347009 RepID=UPI00364F7AE6